MVSTHHAQAEQQRLVGSASAASCKREFAYPSQKTVWQTLQARQFFKVISGGSFTEVDAIAALTRAYAPAGVDCIDIAPDPAVVETVANALHGLDLQGKGLVSPVVMVSLPLDPDPHFRKIELDDPACTRCGLCVPVCPSEALTLPNDLEISQALCYGCGRCVPICPTEALSMLPFQVEDQVETVLRNPIVQAVEIHSRYVDPYMLEAFWLRWEEGLRDKLISLCFRPGDLPVEQILEFIALAERLSPMPILLQIDGAPMSGSADPEASRPALEAACRMRAMLLEQGTNSQFGMPPITISGGINDHTAALIRSNPEYHFVAGVGMGTMARKKTRGLTDTLAIQAAGEVIIPFKTPL